MSAKGPRTDCRRCQAPLRRANAELCRPCYLSKSETERVWDYMRPVNALLKAWRRFEPLEECGA